MEKTKSILKKIWVWSNSYESDESFIIRMKKEYPNEFKNNCYDNNYSYDINRYKALEGTLEADGLEARRNMRNKDN